MRKYLLLSAAGLFGLVAVAGIGCGWAVHRATTRVEAMASKIRLQLGAGGEFTYVNAKVHPFRHSVDLSDVTIRSSGGYLITAEQLTVDGDDPARIASVHANKLHVVQTSANVALTAASFDADGISLGASDEIKTGDMAGTMVRHAVLHGLVLVRSGRSAKLATLSVDDYGTGHHSTLSAAGFSMPLVSGGVDHLGLDALSASGIDLAAILGSGGWPADALFKIAMTGVHAASHGSDVFSIQKAALEKTAQGGGTTTSQVSLTNLSWRPVDARSKTIMTNLGLKVLEANIAENTSYSQDGSAVSIVPSAAIAGIGTLALDVRLSHLDIAGLARLAGEQQNPMDLIGVASKLQILSVSAKFTDVGLVNRMLEMDRKQTGKSVQEINGKVIAQIAQSPLLSELPGSDDIKAALTNFAEHQGSLTVQANPSAPVNVMAIASAISRNDTMTLASRLGVSVKWQQ